MLWDPDEVRELFLAPPDAVHPGEGARVLEPIVGRNSMILLDEGAHPAAYATAETARRRSITFSPGGGATVVLRERRPAPATRPALVSPAPESF